MIDREQITGDLKALDIRTGDAVMMHSSLSALGFVDGGAETVVDALLETVGPEGTLLVPAFRDTVWDDPKNFTNSDCDCTQTGPLCSSEQPGFQGVIAEAVRRRSGSLRSCHPTHSWVALGPASNELLVGHKDCPTFCGSHNPFEPLVEKDGCVLTLGVGVDSITLWHYYEEILQIPYMGHFWPREGSEPLCGRQKNSVRVSGHYAGCLYRSRNSEGRKGGEGAFGADARPHLREFHGDHSRR